VARFLTTHFKYSYGNVEKDMNVTSIAKKDNIYSPHITSRSLQGMRVLRQCKVPRAEIMFVTIQRENSSPSKKEFNSDLRAYSPKSKLPDVCSLVMTHYVSLSLTNRKSSVHLHAMYSPRTALRTFTPRRDQLVICGQ
jgi:hypothetical protein